MRRSIIYIYLIICTLCLAGCEDDFVSNSYLQPSLSPQCIIPQETSFVSYDASAFQRKFNVRSYDIPWIFSDVADWLSLSPNSGDESAEVTLSVTENKDADKARTAIFYLRSRDPEWFYSQAMSVSQERAIPVLTAENSISFEGGASQKSLDINANCTWSAVADKSWFTVSPDFVSGKLNVSVIANPQKEYRNGTIHIYYGNDLQHDVSVSQAPSKISSTAYSLEFDNKSSSKTVTIDSEIAWTCTTSYSWITVTPNHGEAGKTDVNIEVKENPYKDNKRESAVVFRTGSNERFQIDIAQDGVFLEPEQTSITFSGAAQTKSIKIDANCSWSAQSYNSWIKVASNVSQGTLAITVSPNYQSNTIHGNIYLTYGDNYTVTLYVSQAPATMSASNLSLEFDNQASSQNIEIDSELSWTATNTFDWITITPTAGDAGKTTMTINVKSNPKASSRNGLIVLRNGSASTLRIDIVQRGAQLDIETNSISFSGGAGGEIIKVTANCAWSALCSDSWVSLKEDKNSGTLTVSVSPNPKSTNRTSSVDIVYGDGNMKTVKITQAPSNISSSVNKLEYKNVASKYELTLTSDADWTSKVSDSWISVSPENGSAGSSSVSIEVAPNTAVSERNGYVSIYTGDEERLRIAIVQKGIYIDANESLTFSSTQQTKTLSIQSNTNWVVTNKPNWLSLSVNSGSGNGEIAVTSSDNPNGAARSGEIVISQPGLSLKCAVAVTQEGKKLSLDATILEFSDKASSKTFSLSSDASWTASLSDDWFSISPKSGHGNANINVSVVENNSTEERSGTVTFAYADKTTLLNIHQLAKYLTIDNKTFEFGSIGGSHTIDISTNDDWSAEIENNVSWLTLSKTSGSGSASLTLTAKDNPSVNTRSTTVVIHTAHDQSVRILVSQKPRYLTVSTQSILFFANGGKSETIYVETDGTYEIKSESSWFTVTKESDRSFTVTASANTSNEVRTGKLSISLTGLSEGSLTLELSVIQGGKGGTFIKNGYSEDCNWNYVGGGSLNVIINGYTSDKNWDNTGGSSITIKVTGYTSDNDWNINDSTSCRVSINTYGADKDWNNSSNSSGNFKNTYYKSDSNWNE